MIRSTFWEIARSMHVTQLGTVPWLVHSIQCTPSCLATCCCTLSTSTIYGIWLLIGMLMIVLPLALAASNAGPGASNMGCLLAAANCAATADVDAVEGVPEVLELSAELAAVEELSVFEEAELLEEPVLHDEMSSTTGTKSSGLHR